MKIRVSYLKLLTEMFNDPDPEGYIEEFLKDDRFTKKFRDSIALKLRGELKLAAQKSIPMGIELGNCLTAEDAYLLRQRHLSKRISQLELTHTAIRLGILGFIALSMIAWALIF